MTSRTEAQDLMWEFDAVRRLGDAQVHAAQGQAVGHDWRSFHPYIEPGVLWWIFAPGTAALRGIEGPTSEGFEPPKPPLVYRPDQDVPFDNAVLLIDEIDKAEPDVPNNLMVALGSKEFRVHETGTEVRWKPSADGPNDPCDAPLVIITTNEERELPPAFLRRCVVYRFPSVTNEQLKQIATSSEGDEGKEEEGLYMKIAETMRRLAVKERGKRAEVSIAEYLDAVRACRRLGALAEHRDFERIVASKTVKQPSEV